MCMKNRSVTMSENTGTIRLNFALLVFTFMITSLIPAKAQQLLDEDFDTPSALDRWNPEAPWAIGLPLAGPPSAKSGSRVAGTNLTGDYPDNIDARLISSQFRVPDKELRPRLRFWHWFEFARDRGNYKNQAVDGGDFGSIQIRQEGGTWKTLTTYRGSSATVWTHPSISLATYANQSVEIAFYLHTRRDNNNDAKVSDGWFVDNVSIETGPEAFDNPQSFESGLGDWHVWNGTWEVGSPSSGPSASSIPNGSQIAGTRLSGNYNDHTDASLISPSFRVPAADAIPRLRFWHWFNFARDRGNYKNYAVDGGDFGKVSIRPEGGVWTDITIYRGSSAGVWSHASIRLEEYANQSVEIAFQLHTRRDDNYDINAAAGWFIDNVLIETGPEAFGNPQSFESGLGDWHVWNGTWEVGSPSSGPSVSSIPNGSQIAGTRLSGNYDDHTDASLISPSFRVPAADAIPRLRFWHWFNFARDRGNYKNQAIDGGDYGKVRIRPEGGVWTDITTYRGSSAGVWSHASIRLNEYANQSVEIAFQLHTRQDNNYDINSAAGWFIDNVSIETGPEAFGNPQSFESGLGDWHVWNGTWEVGSPSSGPSVSSIPNGSQIAGTRLSGNYNDHTDASLISPSFRVPAADVNPRLHFWHWFNFARDRGDYKNYAVDGGDFGRILIRSKGESWTELAKYEGDSANTWTRPSIPLSSYAGKAVEIAFTLHTRRDDNYDVNAAAGWFIDKVGLSADFIPAIPNQSIPECELFTFSLPTPDDPSVTVSLEGDIPVGATVSLGQLTWFPTEEQGPGDYVFTIVATQEGNSLTPVDRETFTITVVETNKEPSITVPVPQPIQIPASGLVSVPLIISDPDNNGGPYFGDMFQDQFGNNTLNGFETRSEKSNRNWETSQFGERSFAQINGIGANGPSDDWLIIPGLDLTQSENEVLSFESSKIASGPNIEVLVSTSYRRGQSLNRSSWSSLDPELSSGNEVVVPSGDLSLEDYTNSNNVSIAFRYTSTGNTAGKAALWQVGNIRVKGLLPPLEQDILVTLGPDTDPCVTLVDFDEATQQLTLNFGGCTKSEYLVTVRVTDDGAPQGRDAALSSTTTLRFVLGPRCPLLPTEQLELTTSPGVPIERDLIDPSFRPLGSDTMVSTLPIPSLPAVSVVDGVFRWTPTDEQANQTFIFTIMVNQGGTPSCTGIVKVTVPPSTIFAKPASHEASEDQAITIDLLAAHSRPLPPDVSINMEPNLEGASIADGLLTWTPTEEQGGETYTVTFSAIRNNTPFEACPVAINVIEDNKPSFMRAIPDQVMQVGDVFRTELEIEDPDIPPTPITFGHGLVDAPDWITLPSPYEVEAIPTQTGSTTATIRFSDSETGESFVGSFNITVEESPSSVSNLAIDFPGTVTVDQQADGKAKLTEATATTSPRFYSLSNGPEGMTIDPFTGLIEWLPQETQVGTHEGIAVRTILSPDRLQNTRPLLEDETHPRATLAGNEPWEWINNNPDPRSGSHAHLSPADEGLHQHYYTNRGFSRYTDESGFLVTYAYLDPENLPSTVFLQWNNGNWDHRAYWGEDTLTIGETDTASRRYLGPLPTAGQWVRLAVPVEWVDMSDQKIDGMAFGAVDGQVIWDYSGTSPTQFEFTETFSVVVSDAPVVEPEPEPTPPSLHSADYREPFGIIDGTEANRVLAYWRAGAYHVEAAGDDGYAPGEGTDNGDRHSADYRDPSWRIDGTEVNRVLAYWRSGGYRPDPAGADGFAPNTDSPAVGLQRQSRSNATSPELAIHSLTPSTANTWLLEASLTLLANPTALAWQPALSEGWALRSISGDAHPDLVADEVVWTGSQLGRSLEISIVVEQTMEHSDRLRIGGDIEAFYAASPNAIVQSIAAVVFELEAPRSELTLQRQPDGHFTLTPNSAGKFRIESSTDLKTWHIQDTIQVDEGMAPVAIKQIHSPTEAHRFYRLSRME